MEAMHFYKREISCKETMIKGTVEGFEVRNGATMMFVVEKRENDDGEEEIVESWLDYSRFKR
jgi:hypothetical protein